MGQVALAARGGHAAGAHGDVEADEDESISIRRKLQKGKGMGTGTPETKSANFWKAAGWQKHGWILWKLGGRGINHIVNM